MATAGQTAIATVSEVDSLGVSFPITYGRVSFTSSDSTVATVSANLDGTATVTAVGPGTASISAYDSMYNLGATANVTVTAAAPSPASNVPVSLAISIGEFSTPSATTGNATS